ncbi:MAG: choline kinase [Ancylobacter novellus]|uniref:Choline kinase n=1 Tax=Ancylobacter novellus TaxID=921 RepID=A0A2W5MNF6_ANCNO|nr:MAG: choline kinase [Ancylobacter novellus]
MTDASVERVRTLSFWRGAVEPRPLTGGITNRNFVVEDAGKKFVVRLGDDIPLHNCLRFNEQAAAAAAEAAGVSPAVRHVEPGLMVIDHVEGRTFTEADVRAELPRVAALVRTAHREVTRRLRGPALAFWTFHILRSYVATLQDGGHRLAAELPRLADVADRIEAAVGPTEIVYGHNDLLPGNFIDDGDRLWLIDWDYGGFNSPWFDLGNLASNNGLDEAGRDALIGLYFGREARDADRLKLAGMMVASLLRESLWSMVSELHSTLDFDYRAYTAENLARFERALERFESMDHA